ncbi:MAG: hypothetical protein GQ574_12090 [Crocinitomix sp.]|nr:hypothetical protein [Crocinitomix sp.]
MKIFFTLFILSIGFISFGQNVIKGTVVGPSGNAVPGARISVEKTTYGVPSSNNGGYFLEVPETDTVIVKYNMIGFAERIDTLIFVTAVIEHNVTLDYEAVALGTVEIYADDRNIVKEVIGHVIDNKKNMRNQYESYQCKTYIKTSLEKEEKNGFLKAARELQGGGDPNSQSKPADLRQKMNFIESNSITRFKRRNTYKETIIAHNDYAEKTNSSVVVSADFSDPNSIMPSQVIEYNPYIFFEKVADGDFDLYQNLIELPKVAANPIVSPFAANAFLNYKYSLNNIFIEDGQKIYDIQVEPRFKETALFSGKLFIIDSLWVVKSMDLSINPSAMGFFKAFRIIEDFEQVDGKWVVERREFTYTINDGQNIVMGNTRVNHTGYEFNLDFDKKTFKNVVMEYDEEAFNKDSAYWAEVRPIQLKPEELAFIHEQDSITKLLESDTYVDSVNADYNRLRFWDFVLSGVGFRNREKKQEIYINPLVNQVQPFGIGGYRHKLGGSYSKEFENAQAIKVDGFIDYGFRNRDVKGQLGVEYTYLPKHFGSLKVSGGDIYDFVTMEQSITNFLSRGNYVRKTFFEITQRYELFNGLYGRFTFDYSTRRDISNIEKAPWAEKLGEALNWPEIVPYDTYTVSIFELELLYRFKQKYILKGNKKIVIGTQFPEVRMKFKKGVPNLFNSDVNFNFLEIGASDKVNFGTFGDLKWDVEAGTFFGKTAGEVQYIEQKFFRGSDLFFFSQPLMTMQLLDSTFNTTQPYLSAFAIHHFNGAIMGKIPLINKLKIHLVAGAAALFIQENDYAHIEVYAGIERIFKIKRQLFKLSTFYVVRSNGEPSVNFNFKFGFDFFNSFTNSWSY